MQPVPMNRGRVANTVGDPEGCTGATITRIMHRRFQTQRNPALNPWDDVGHWDDWQRTARRLGLSRTNSCHKSTCARRFQKSLPVHWVHQALSTVIDG